MSWRCRCLHRFYSRYGDAFDVWSDANRRGCVSGDYGCGCGFASGDFRVAESCDGAEAVLERQLRLPVAASRSSAPRGRL